MSTRSGKRIHSSFHENILKPDLEHVVQSERKTRSKRLKENNEELSISIMKTKKRSNYVSYPTDDEALSDSKVEGNTKPSRLLRKNALKEFNNIVPTSDSSELQTEVPKPVKTTRRTRRFAEETEEVHENLNHAEEVVNGKTKSKQEKKKQKSISAGVVEEVPKKKTKKKGKKAKRSGSMVVEDIVPVKEKTPPNKMNMSTDSFYSAAGSPLQNTEEDVACVTSLAKDKVILKSADAQKPVVRQTKSVVRKSLIDLECMSDSVIQVSHKRKSSFKDLDTTATNNEEMEEFDITLTRVSKKRKSSIRDTVSTKKVDTANNGEVKDSTFDLNDLEKRKSVIKTVLNSTYEKSETSNFTAFNKQVDLNISDKKESTSIIQTPQSTLDSTFEKLNCKSPIEVKSSITEEAAINTTFNKDDPVVDSVIRKSAVINTTYDKDSENDTKPPYLDDRKSSVINVTYEKDDKVSESERCSTNVRKSLHEKPSELNSTYEKTEKTNLTFEKDSNPDNVRKSLQEKPAELNSTYEKTEKTNLTFEKDSNPDTTFEKDKNPEKAYEKDKNADVTFDKDKKLNTTFNKNSKSSLISSDLSNITLDKSEVSRISITSDDSKDYIVNTTPVLIESSMDESQINTSKPKQNQLDIKPENPPENSKNSLPLPITPLKRESTFTKEVSDVNDKDMTGSNINETGKLPKTPIRKMSLPSPGCTPFPNKSGLTLMNVTRSLEKSRRSSLAEPLPRATKVMFCSPVNNPAVVAQQRRKVIKSNLKGSNKSFVFEDEAPEPRAAARKRSYTYNDADVARNKRTRGTEGAPPARRLRTSSSTAKLPDPSTPSKKTALTPKKSESKISRTKLPNFAALHQREFAKMESLDECQERRARRAKQLLTPTGAVTVLERSPKDTETKLDDKSPQHNEDQTSTRKQSKKPETPIKSLPTLRSLNPGYTRFGFKLNCDVNPFSLTSNDKNSFLSSKKNTIKKDLTRPLKEIKALKRQATLPSLTGTTSAREVAKQTVMREKSFTDKRIKMRTENRTVIKGVRTNRRFELQMRMRNMD